MGKKKKGGKKGPPEGTPLEDYETAEMKIKELQKYAVQLGALLNEARSDRSNFEIDRNKVLRNLINVVCRQMMINREIRGLDRELINKENLFERTVSDKINELAELRFRQIPQYYRNRNDLFVNIYEAQRKLFRKQDQMFQDRIGLSSDYYKKYLELEGTFMAAKHASLCDKMDKVNENNISNMLWTERKYYQRQKEIDQQTDEQNAKIIKFSIDRKEKIIENIQKEHIFDCVDIFRSFEEIMKYNFTVINELSEELSSLKQGGVKVMKEHKELKEKYELYCALAKETKKEIVTIRPVIKYIHHTKAAEMVYSKRLEEIEEETTDSLLEIDMLEDFVRKEDECKQKLKQITMQDLLLFRQLQVRAHLFMMNLGKRIEEMYKDRIRLGKLTLRPMEVNVRPFEEMFERYRCYRRSMVDIVERLLRTTASSIQTLGFPLEEPPILPKLPPRSLSADTQISRQKRSNKQGAAMPSVFKTFSKSAQNKLQFIKSLPRVRTTKKADHLLPFLQVQEATIYIKGLPELVA